MTTRFFKRALATAIAVVVAGCSVTPTPLDDQTLSERATADTALLFQNQEPISDPVSLYDAIARAIRYNLDHRIKLLEHALAQGELDLLRYEQLPDLTVAAGYHWRNNYSGASSQSLLTGTESLEPSTSQEKQFYTADLSMAWNLIDFGITYLNSKQQADRLLILEEQRRKALQNIIQDVQSAFRRAAIAQQLLPEMDDLIKQAETTLSQSREILERRLDAPEKTLEYQKSLLTLIRRLWSMREELSTARTELSGLMNIAPGTDYELKIPLQQDGVAQDKRITKSITELENLALVKRPEVREEHYQTEIASLEIKKAYTRMLPGIEVDLGRFHDTNDFLYNNNWTELALRLSWNMFNILSGPTQIKYAEAGYNLHEAKRLATYLAVLTQVHLSYQRYHLALKSFRLDQDQTEVESLLLKNTLAQQRAARQYELEVIRIRAAELAARLRRDISHAELKNAETRLITSIGMDLLPGNLPDADLKALSKAVESSVTSWQYFLTNPG